MDQSRQALFLTHTTLILHPPKKARVSVAACSGPVHTYTHTRKQQKHMHGRPPLTTRMYMYTCHAREVGHTCMRTLKTKEWRTRTFTHPSQNDIEVRPSGCEPASLVLSSSVLLRVDPGASSLLLSNPSNHLVIHHSNGLHTHTHHKNAGEGDPPGNGLIAERERERERERGRKYHAPLRPFLGSG